MLHFECIVGFSLEVLERFWDPKKKFISFPFKVKFMNSKNFQLLNSIIEIFQFSFIENKNIDVYFTLNIVKIHQTMNAPFDL